MPKIRLHAAVILVILCSCCSQAHAYTTEHHLVNMSRHLANMIGAPVKALFIEGPQEIRKMYTYEVREREKPEKRDRLFRKLYALMSAPVVATKKLVDGATTSVTYAGKFISEFFSIPFCD